MALGCVVQVAWAGGHTRHKARGSHTQTSQKKATGKLGQSQEQDEGKKERERERDNVQDSISNRSDIVQVFGHKHINIRMKNQQRRNSENFCNCVTF